VPRTISLSWMDWLTLAIVLVSLLRGARYGLLAGIGDVLVLVASFYAASYLYPQAIQFLNWIPMLTHSWRAMFSFVMVWLVLYIPLTILVRLAFGGASFPGSRVLGALWGGFRGLVLVTALLIVTLAAPFRDIVARDADHSLVAPYLLRASDQVQSVLIPILPVHVPRLGPGGIAF
jgi:uncharacterized membrane protein required for colicin V production